MTDRKYELGNEKLSTLLYRYSTPSIIAMIVNSMYNLVDTIFVGKGAGTLALAGLAVSFPVQMIILALAQTVGIGAASIISRSLGAGEGEKANRIAGASFMFVAILGVCWSILGLFFVEPLLKVFGANANIMPYAKAYLSVILLGNTFFGLSVSSNNLIRSEGNAKVAMNTMLIGAITNIILDPIFIFTLKMGIRGAAIATIIAQMMSFSYIMYYFLSGSSMLKIKREYIRIDLPLFFEIFKIGSASLARMVAGSVLAIVLNHSLIHYGSEIYIAILGIINRLMMFMFMPIFGLVQGLQPIIGFNYGAKKNDRVLEALKLGSIAATAVSTTGFLILFFFPGQVLGLFSDSKELIAAGLPMIRIIMLATPIIGFQVVGSSLFQALGKAKPALFLSMARQFLFLIPLILIFPFYWGLHGVIYAFPVSDVLSFSITLWLVIKQVKGLRLCQTQSADCPEV